MLMSLGCGLITFLEDDSTVGRTLRENPMPGKNANKLTKRSVDGLRVEGKDAIFWDRDLPGFGVRVYPTGRKVYVVQSRGPTGPKRASIGRHGPVSADQARKQATVIIDRIKRGEDPAPPPPRRELTVADLAERYLRAHVQVNCRRSTAAGYRHIVTHYIVPELGECPIAAVSQSSAMRPEPATISERGRRRPSDPRRRKRRS